MDTLFTGKIVTSVTETTSTNELASIALKKSSVIEGAVFRAENQTHGKGQRGSVWNSLPNQNLLLSYIYFPVFLKADEQFYLVKAVSLAVKDLLDKYLVDKAKIKWPNDVYINDLKIAGILIESTMKGSYMGSSIIGIGLNVNQRIFPELVNATSVVLETGRGCDLDMFFKELSFHLERRYLMLKKDMKSLDIAYENALYRKDHKSRYLVNDTKIELTLRKVDDLGQLVLENENGELHAYGMHQVRMVL